MIQYYAIPGLKYRDRILKAINPGKTNIQKMEYIIDTVCDIMGVDKLKVFSKYRNREFVFARQLSIYFIRQRHPEISLKNIGKHLGGRDHTTAIHSIQTIKNLMDTEDRTRAIVKLIDDRL